MGLNSISIAWSMDTLRGLWAGYCTGRLSDDLIMRLVDVILAPSSILLTRALVALIGPGKVLRVVMVLQ